MLNWRNCGKVNVNITAKILFCVVFFVFVYMVQLKYLRTYRVEEIQADNTHVHTRSPKNKTQKDSLKQSPQNQPEKPPPSRYFQDLKPSPKAQRENAPPLKNFPDSFFKPPYQPLIYGKPRLKKGYLTIGIPSVKRPNTDRIYLYDTLNSLLEKIPEAEYHQITIVVMISDTNKTYNTEVSTSIYGRYKAFCDDGMIHVLNTPDSIYPDLDNVKKTFNDAKPRLKWRAKQNVDFAFMMLYCRHLSQFYIQLEDDVVVSKDFIQDIRTFITKMSQTWFLLEFSRLGFIGKLFRSSDLEFVSMYLLKKYDVAPCDLLLGDIRIERGQKRHVYSNHGLFQHIGRFSSLKDKIMPSVDKTFKGEMRMELIGLPLGDNPPARTSTYMTFKEGHIPDHAYDNDNSTYFWAKTTKKGDQFTLTFDKPYNFSRIIIPTGVLKTKQDSFLNSDLWYSQSTTLDESTNRNTCVNKFLKLADLVEGEMDTKATGTFIPSNIKCLRISATRNAVNWIIIRDIQLFVRH